MAEHTIVVMTQFGGPPKAEECRVCEFCKDWTHAYCNDCHLLECECDVICGVCNNGDTLPFCECN